MEVNRSSSIHKFGMYLKDFFKGQKTLFIKSYLYEMNEKVKGENN